MSSWVTKAGAKGSVVTTFVPILNQTRRNTVEIVRIITQAMREERMNHRTSHHQAGRTDFRHDKRPGIDPGQTYFPPNHEQQEGDPPSEGKFSFEPDQEEGKIGKPSRYRITIV